MNISGTREDIKKRKTPLFSIFKGLSNKLNLFLLHMHFKANQKTEWEQYDFVSYSESFTTKNLSIQFFRRTQCLRKRLLSIQRNVVAIWRCLWQLDQNFWLYRRTYRPQFWDLNFDNTRAQLKRWSIGQSNNDIVKYFNKTTVWTKMLTMSDQGCDFVGHWQILVGYCRMINSYLQPWLYVCMLNVGYNKLVY